METTIVGLGQSFSYDYSDVFSVQAIAKTFNGTRSATRRVADFRQRLSSSTGAQIMNVASDEPSDPSMIEAYRSNAEREMNIVLEEALNCHDCDQVQLDPKAMENDIAHGIYQCIDDPPFSLMIEEEVAPDEMVTKRWEPGYRRYETPLQRERYLAQVESYIEKSLAASGSTNRDAVIQFAYYCVDYHIHQHYLARRSILNLCRGEDEMNELRIWRWQLSLVTSKKKLSPSFVAEAISSSPFSPTAGAEVSSQWPWAGNQISMNHQIVLFCKHVNQRQHARHVRSSCNQFKATMRKRVKQRKDGLIVANHYAAISRMNWFRHSGETPVLGTRPKDLKEICNYMGR